MISNVHKHRVYMFNLYNHNTKFEYKGMKTAWKCFKFNICQKSEKKWNLHKIGGAHLQCVNNHYAKFEYKVMNTVGVTDYTN